MKKIGIVYFFVFIIIFNCYAGDKTSDKNKSDTKASVIKQRIVTETNVIENKKMIKKLTFIELGSVNCIPCKMMKPVMENIEKEYKDSVKVLFYDVWTSEGKPYGEFYKIRAIPTQIFLDADGVEFFRHIGFFPKEEIIELLDKEIKKQ